MGKQSPEPGKTNNESLQSTVGLSGTVKTRQFYAWDDYSMLVLSVILTGTFPLVITSGIAIGAIFWTVLSQCWAIIVGVGAGVGMVVLEGLLLILLTRPCVRQRLIPLARWFFPSSGEVAKKYAGKSG